MKKSLITLLTFAIVTAIMLAVAFVVVLAK